jgi:hypothetical protein
MLKSFKVEEPSLELEQAEATKIEEINEESFDKSNTSMSQLKDKSMSESPMRSEMAQKSKSPSPEKISARD